MFDENFYQYFEILLKWIRKISRMPLKMLSVVLEKYGEENHGKDGSIQEHQEQNRRLDVEKYIDPNAEKALTMRMWRKILKSRSENGGGGQRER